MTNVEPAPAAFDALADDYEILRELGRGGTAVVYLARERSTGDDVAIKLVRAQFADDDEARARLAREARFVEQLRHPNIVPLRAVLDFGDSGVALVMTHVPGRTLREILREEGALPPHRAARVLRDVASALGAAHALGIVHRDVKPENVFITDDERAVLADFGIARSMSAESQQLTMHGVAIGTPAYMAPEQIDGEHLDARADIYSLGLLGWEMITGRRPFAGEALYSVLYHQKHVQLDDPRTLQGEVPSALVSALAGAVEKERDARWLSADAFLAALEGNEELREWPASAPAGGATVRVERTGLPVPAESVVAIDWREAMEPPTVLSSWRSSSRRGMAFGAGIGALAALALVVSAVRIHSREVADSAQPAVANGPLVVTDAPQSVPLAATTVAPAAPPASDSSRSSAPPAPPRGVEPSPITKPAVPVAGASVSVAPRAPATVTSRVRVSVGGRHSCLLSEDGRAFCWGSNDRGQLGTGATTRLSAPLSPVTGERFTAIASGMTHTCALTAGGDAWCWGDNDAGQLGDRGAGNQSVPVRVAGGHRFSTLAAGWAFTCGLDENGGAWCWGSDAAGELGDVASGIRRAPVHVLGGHTFVSIAAGSAHACGIAADGSAWCWGSNSSGQLGDGTTTNRWVPVRVQRTGDFRSITAGAVHSCALVASGDAWCWGSNVYGQLGNDNNTDSAVPVRVVGGHSFVALRAFGSHDCGVTTAGETFCWGYNLDGQLGDGSRTHRARPVYVQRPGAP